MCCALEIPNLCLCWFCCFHAILGSQLRSQGFQSGKGFLLFDSKNRNRRRNSESLQHSFFSNLPREDLSHFGYIWAGPRRMLFGNTQQDSGVPSLVLPWSIEALISEFVEILRSCQTWVWKMAVEALDCSVWIWIFTLGLVIWLCYLQPCCVQSPLHLQVSRIRFLVLDLPPLSITLGTVQVPPGML